MAFVNIIEKGVSLLKSCEEYSEKISCLIDGELSEEDKAELCLHLEACPECRTVYETLRALSEEIRSMDAKAPADFTGGVMDAVRQSAVKQPTVKQGEKEKQSVFRGGRFAFGRFTAVAAVFAVIILALSRILPGADEVGNSGDTAKSMTGAGNYAASDEADAGEPDAEMYAGESGVEMYSAGGESPVAEQDGALRIIAPEDAEADVIEDTKENEGSALSDSLFGASEPNAVPETAARQTSVPVEIPGGYYAVLTIRGAIPAALEEYDVEESGGVYYIAVPAEVMPELLETVEYVEYYEEDASADEALVVVLPD